MGELHLEVLTTRLTREFGVHANVGKPMVAYRETIAATAEASGQFIRQSGGKGQYGDVRLRVQPNTEGGIVFENQVRDGEIPREFFPAIESGVTSALENGIIAGYPVVDVKVTLLGGSYHDVDSSDIAFKAAGKKWVPSKCMGCWKVVVRLKTLKQLFSLLQLQMRMGRPSKCGIEVRESVNGLYGGYFYNHSLEEGLECYSAVA